MRAALTVTTGRGRMCTAVVVSVVALLTPCGTMCRGAIRAEHNVSITCLNCRIEGCVAYYGGGICSEANSRLQIVNSTFVVSQYALFVRGHATAVAFASMLFSGHKLLVMVFRSRAVARCVGPTKLLLAMSYCRTTALWLAEVCTLKTIVQ